MNNVKKYHSHPLVEAVSPMSNYFLEVLFDTGEYKLYDVKPLFKKIDVFKELKSTNGLFRQVVVGSLGHAVEWNDDIDIAAEELYCNGVISLSSKRSHLSAT